MSRTEHRDPGGRLKSYSQKSSDRYKWLPRWGAWLLLGILAFGAIKEWLGF
jgi:hypothetical protein